MAEVYLHQSGIANDVREAVHTLKEIVSDDLRDYEGKVWLIPSVDVHTGTGIHDLDLLVIGYLNDYYVDEISGFQDIEIKSFCTTIEVKSHTAEGIFKDGTSLYVRYPGETKNVTQQSEKQKETLKKFLKDALQYKEVRMPYITNVIWLIGIDSEDFDESVGLINSNIITSDFTIDDFFCAIGRQSRLKDQGFFDAFKGYSPKEIENIAGIFCAKSSGVDTMTLRRINLLNHNSLYLSDLEAKKEPLIILSGHAGTGKTIMLLQAADKLTKKGYKCLFLTYNIALISDLKHTMEYLPNKVSEIEMTSMHSFMISILYKHQLWNKSSRIESDFIPAMSTLNRIKEKHSWNFDYDYVFVDEAQDWEKPIPEVLKYLFKKKHIVIADGVDQFMQASEHTEWGTPFLPTLKKCLRQRYNLTVFTKLFANKMGVFWNVEPNNELPGGKVHIYTKYTPEIHQSLVNDLHKHSCTEYDLMLLAARSTIKDGKFTLLEAYRNAGIQLFDGVDKEKRSALYTKENAKNHESRVYTYESCRGLEAWTTVCLRFNELFTEPHPHDYHEINYTFARQYMLTLWSLIPLTRAVDTLVLVVLQGSDISKLLKEIANENPGFVTYHE